MAQTINVDMTPGLFMPTLHYSQGDIGREFVINLATRDGMTIPAGATVTMQATKPSGFGFSVAGSLSGTVATFTSTAEMTDESGRFQAEIVIAQGTTVIGTTNFWLEGEKNPHPEGTIDGQEGTVIPELTLLVQRAETAAGLLLNCSADASSLPAGSNPTASYDPETGEFTFGIPEGEAGAGAAGVVASAYSSSKTYAVGDYVIHNSNLYRCTTAITTAESFTAAHWTQVVLGDDVSDLKADIGVFNVVELTNTTDYVPVFVEPNAKVTVKTADGSQVSGSKEICFYTASKTLITSIWLLNGTAKRTVTYDGAQKAYYAKLESAADIIVTGNVRVIDDNAIGYMFDALLAYSTIPNTTAQVTRDADGKITKVVHKRNNFKVREDTYTYSASSIEEVRTLYNGLTKTTTLNLETLEMGVA